MIPNIEASSGLTAIFSQNSSMDRPVRVTTLADYVEIDDSPVAMLL